VWGIEANVEAMVKGKSREKESGIRGIREDLQCCARSSQTERENNEGNSLGNFLAA
jgi:hypothetical protein